MRNGAEGPSPACPELEVAEQSAVGSGRSHSEDHVRHCVPEEARLRSRKGVLCLVADGMGGHRAGEVASREAVDVVMRQYYADPSRDLAGSLSRALRDANRSIGQRAEADRARAGMGTTMVAAAIRGSQVTIANVGDSRAYHVGTRGMVQITQDHSWVEEQVRAGMLTPEQARSHPQRNLVTRALGSRPEVEIDLYEGMLEPGDCLVLCTDGLSNVAEDREIAESALSHPPAEAAQALVDLVRSRAGRDDATILIARLAGGSVTQKPLGKRRSRLGTWPVLLLAAAMLLGLVALLLVLLPGV